MDFNTIKNTERTFWCQFNDEVKVELRHLTRDELRDIYKKATKTSFFKNQKTDEFDPVKADCLLGRAAVKNWDGFTDDGNPAPCTPEAIDMLMTRYNIFAKFVNEMCVDIDALVQAEKEDTAKN